MNGFFGKLNDGALEIAPDTFPPNPAKPTDAEYLAHGFMRLHAAENAPVEEGYVYNQRGWEIRDGEIYPHWEREPIPAPVRVFSVAKVIYWATEHGIFDALKAACGESVTLQMVALGEVREDNEDLQEMLPALVAAFGEETVNACLAYAAGGDDAE